MARDWDHQLQFYNGVADIASCQTKFSFAPLLRQWHGEDWILDHTEFRFNSDGRLHRKTGLRAQRGGVSRRWHEGVEHASRMAQWFFHEHVVPVFILLLIFCRLVRRW